MNKNKDKSKSIIIDLFAQVIEIGNRWLTFSGLFFRNDKNVFRKIEFLTIFFTLLSGFVLLIIGELPIITATIIAILLGQRVVEFMTVYTRNFVFNRGRIFTHFKDSNKRGQWLILMFTLNIIQINLIFAVWYRLITTINSEAFSQSLSILDSFYFSIVTFLTIGYGDVIPVTASAKLIVIFQSVLTFYTLFIVINGLIYSHFRQQPKSS